MSLSITSMSPLIVLAAIVLVFLFPTAFQQPATNNGNPVGRHWFLLPSVHKVGEQVNYGISVFSQHHDKS